MSFDELSALIALTLGVGWASGINLYAAVLALGLAGATGYAELPPGLEVIQDPKVIAVAGLMYCVEFFTDKVPGVDTGWDAIHTFIRVPAGALLASGMLSEQGIALELAAGLIGGGLAATSHVTKTGGRVLINTSPEPVTNWTASLAEDISVFTGIWMMLNHPVLFLLCLVFFILFVIWLLPKIWRGIKFLYLKIKALFSGKKQESLANYEAEYQRKNDVYIGLTSGLNSNPSESPDKD